MERFVAVVMVLGLAACTGDKDGELGACAAKDGTWESVLTLQDGSDALCPAVPPDTFTTGDDSTSTADDCDPGCTCGIVEDEATCSATYTQSCADAESETDLSCEMTMDGDSAMSGSCSVSVHVLDPDLTVDCDYTIEATWQSP